MSAAKWDDTAVKDLCMAIIMSNSPDGNISVAANWDKVAQSMSDWGYTFTKGAMSQHWSKKVVREFKERHAKGDGTAPATPNKAAGPRKRAATKNPGSGRSKKRAAEDDDSPNSGVIAEPSAKKRTPRSVKKVKYDAEGEDANTKAEAMEMDENILVEEEEEDEKEAEFKAEKEDTDYTF